METVDNKLGYIKGILDESNGVEKDTRKILSGMLDVLRDLDRSGREMVDLFAELNDYVESIDDDLSDLEDGNYPAESEPSSPRLHAVPDSRALEYTVCDSCRGILSVAAGTDKCICPLCGVVTRVSSVSLRDIPRADPAD